MRSVIAIALTLIVLAFPASAQSSPSTDVRQCAAALVSFERQLRASPSGVSHEWPRAQVGWLLLSNRFPRPVEDTLLSTAGSRDGIMRCPAAGIGSRETQLFLLALHGYLPPDPFEALSQCFAGFIAVAPMLDRALGVQRSEAFGVAIGETIGSTISHLGVLYPTRKQSLTQTQRRAETIATALESMSGTRRSTTLASYVSQCDAFQVPVSTMLKGSGISLR